MEDRKRVIEKLYNIGCDSEEIDIIDSFIEEKGQDYLNKLLELLAVADLAVFGLYDWLNTLKGRNKVRWQAKN